MKMQGVLFTESVDFANRTIRLSRVGPSGILSADTEFADNPIEGAVITARAIERICARETQMFTVEVSTPDEADAADSQRETGCKYCCVNKRALNDQDADFFNGMDIILGIDNGKPKLVATCYKKGDIRGVGVADIEYCPKCGRKLGGSAQ